jgi:hypothetical protein
MTCQRRADGAAPQRSTHCLPLIGFNFQTANAQDVLRSSIASLSENVSRTRCSVLPAMRSIVRSRCTAEPGPKGNPRGAWAPDHPDQQRTTPQGKARRKTRVNALMALRSIRGTQPQLRDLAAPSARVLLEIPPSSNRGEQGMPDAWRVRSRVRSGRKHTR